MNALVSIEKVLEPGQALTAGSLFGGGQIETLLAAIERDVRSELFEIETEAGRERVKSVAYKIARSKTTLDEIGKEHVAEIKAQSAAIDAQRRTIRDRLDALKEEVRGPLTIWEETEAKRVAEHEAALVLIIESTRFVVPPTAEMVRSRIAEIGSYDARDWQEFQERAEAAYRDARSTLDAMEEAAEQRERDQAELAELRQLKAERDARDAAAAARKAEADRAAERARLEEIATANRLAAQAEADAERAEQAERDKEAAAALAVEQERRRVAAQKAAEETAERKRQENTRHRNKVHQQIREDLVGRTISREVADLLIDAIAAGSIRNLSINY